MNTYVFKTKGAKMTNVKLTQRQAEFLDHLLWKEQSYKKKRGIKWIDAITKRVPR
jgi:hypothetical protein